MSGTTHLLVGTTKGAFILTASSDRSDGTSPAPIATAGRSTT
jgi:hypothetical protein